MGDEERRCEDGISSLRDKRQGVCSGVEVREADVWGVGGLTVVRWWWLRIAGLRKGKVGGCWC